MVTLPSSVVSDLDRVGLSRRRRGGVKAAAVTAGSGLALDAGAGAR
jgi:hypothetical protein